MTSEHLEALNRQRRIAVQYDAGGQWGAPFAEWLAYRFTYLDQPGGQVDSVWWDIGAGSWATYPSEVLPPFEHPGLRFWRDEGRDWVAELVAACRQRGLEVFWNHRVSEVDLETTTELEPGQTLQLNARNPVKAEHPDWVIRTWWWQGLWDYSVPAVREYQLAILRELAQNYDLDGFQLDFARHIPCLPVGRQWELREHVTEFLRMVRGMLQETAAARGKPYLLATRIPHSLAGCQADGFDVAAWAAEELVDILTLGTRSLTVDLADFRAVTAGTPIKLQPCHDDHHASDGYRFTPLEYLRGVFANWWQQGADSVLTFNWPNADPGLSRELVQERWGRGYFNEPGTVAHGQAYREVGSPETLACSDKVFVVERRGGYPWAEGYFNRNDDAPLPLALRHDGTAARLHLRLAETESLLTLRVIIFGAREGDRVGAWLNGTELACQVLDHAWKDPQIMSPAPQPPSGGGGQYVVNPQQRLLRLEFAVPSGLARVGANEVAVAVAERAPYCCTELVVEKVEAHLRHG